jgi:DNA repair protein RecO (recombination protein O)
MQWQDEGIVLAARRHGEHGLVVQLLTRDHGRHAGLVRGGQGPRLRAVYQTGNHLAVTWKARLAEHLGGFAGETLSGHAARLIEDGARLACLAAAAALAETALAEREPQRRIYDGLLALLEALDRDQGWAVAYVGWELALLTELGFGLDLTRCAATGETADLVYVSPKSGQAVSAAAGAPYRDRLLPLPRFLRAGADVAAPQAAEIVDGLALTGYFLGRRVFVDDAGKMPPARSRFVDLVQRMATLSRS